MPAPSVLPQADLALDELVCEIGRARLFRRRLGDGTALLCQRALGPEAAKRRAHELTILERLRGVRGVPQLSRRWTAADLIVFEEAGACLPLAVVRGERADWLALARFAAELARSLGLIHRRGVLHGGIQPESILVTGAGATPLLVFFDLASSFAEERPGFIHHNEIAGALAYLAPEQTGRTGRAVDQRADLYSLGATLYHLASARPPFASEDPLHQLHDLLARTPDPLSVLEPSIPSALSEIVARLLEKEPDRRYQSADGLAHDLSRASELLANGRDCLFALGERDFPLRLSAPARLVGREAESRALRSAFDDARYGSRRGVLIAGAPGVGKTALVNELKPLVTERGGWFVSGKFDQHRQDLASDAVNQAFRALGRLLLAEPESELVALRERILGLLGPNAGLFTSLLPEFALLLDAQPEGDLGDPLQTEGRLIQSGLDLLRAIVSPERPIVMVLDDLQWSTSTPINFIDALLMDDSLQGLLMVGAYRDADVDAAHPLAALLSRWERLGAAPPTLQLKNLPTAAVSTLLDEMLRLGPGMAAELADAVGRRTAGNPYDTVELVNALRRDGVLTPGESGWSWDRAAIRGYLGHGDVLGLLAARIERLPGDAKSLVEIMACLGGEVALDLLAPASGLGPATLEERLAPALEDGLLVMVHAAGSAVCFRHDRVQQAAYGRLAPEARRTLHLRLARNLADSPERASLAAEQYLPAVAAIEAAHERRRVAELMHEVAHGARLVNFQRAERFLSAALSLLGEPQTPGDLALVAQLRIAHHAALYSLARLEQADRVYAEIAQHLRDPLELTDAACVQISSLCNRGLQREALALGFGLLVQLGFEAPGEDVSGEVARGMVRLFEWFAAVDHAAELRRPEIESPRIKAAALLINRLMAPAFFQNPMAAFWMVLQAQRLWSEHGPCAALVGPLSYTGFVTIALRQDYHTCHAALRRVLAVSQARGYEPGSSHASFLYSVSVAHWTEPLEGSLSHARRAHEGLLRAGDLQNACFTYWTSIFALLECSSLESLGDEVDAALAFTKRTGNEQVAFSYLPYRQLVRALRGQTLAPGSFSDASFDEQQLVQSLTPNTAVSFHIVRALSAVLVGTSADLIRHAGAALPLLAYIPAAYSTALAQLLQALALAERLHDAAAGGREPLLAELDRCRDWLALRAADAPVNFLHLLKLVEAERACARGEPWAAAAAFDAALHEVDKRARPWHRALITERAARFHYAQGLEHAGRGLMAQARRHYEAWGATAKVEQLQRAYDLPRGDGSPSPARAEPETHADSVDLLAILRASQTLSSETNLDRLRVRVVELLGAITGATSVRVAMWRDDPGGFWLPAGAEGEAALSLEDAGARRLLPLSVLRYAERTKKPLVIDDATRDDRFARDPYLAGLERCSLLVVPILRQGVARALLLLENRLSRGAFSADRLDAVMLISGQLAVSLENALLYASLERKVEQRTLELTKANGALQGQILQRKLLESQLVQAQKLESLGQLASGMAHEINTPLQFVSDNVQFIAEGFENLTPLMTAYRSATDALPELRAAEQSADVDYLLEQVPSALRAMNEGLTRISAIVRGMKDFAHPSGKEKSAADLNRNIQSTLTIARGEWKYVAELEIELGELPAVRCHAGEINQVLLNIVVNAAHAIADVVGDSGQKGTIRVRSFRDGDDVVISVADTGAGIPGEIRHRIFDPFFTTKPVGRGTGQGLAIAYAIVARKHGGSLTVESEIGHGTTFFIRLPIDGGQTREGKLPDPALSA